LGSATSRVANVPFRRLVGPPPAARSPFSRAPIDGAFLFEDVLIELSGRCRDRHRVHPVARCDTDDCPRALAGTLDRNSSVQISAAEITARRRFARRACINRFRFTRAFCGLASVRSSSLRSGTGQRIGFLGVVARHPRCPTWACPRARFPSRLLDPAQPVSQAHV
jgi:hypothetical protein